jgi:Protein of unknown function, DUF547
MRFLALIASACMLAMSASIAAQPFDHSHATWSELLKRNVVSIAGGNASQVRYAGMKAEHGALKRYLAALSSVSAAEFQTFTPAQQKAFLINAYNAFTVELILSRYPKMESIKDLGSLLQSPWEKKFVPLLGETVSLDDIEHVRLRAPGRYDDPRLHFALNCASIGCPLLRDEAFTADRLDAQLDDQTKRFMSDRSRNRWNAAKQELEVSQIFDWYGDDFEQGHRGIESLDAFFARYADQLADAPADRQRIRSRRADVDFLEYDWRLNDAAR